MSDIHKDLGKNEVTKSVSQLVFIDYKISSPLKEDEIERLNKIYKEAWKEILEEQRVNQPQLPFFEDSGENSSDKIINQNSQVLSKFGIGTNLAKFGEYFVYYYKKRANKIEKPPASFLLKVADLLPKKNRQNLEQEISDMRIEYYDALNEKNIWRARFIVAYYYVGLSWSGIMWIPDKVKELLGRIPKKN
ncbi:MAG TPA: hypothetical protein VF599_07060 [Pyrinomonadaceae bacterium]|jgi:hypothetical protein